MDTDPPMDTAEAILPGSRKFLEATLAANLSYDLKERRTRVITLGPYYLQWGHWWTGSADRDGVRPVPRAGGSDHRVRSRSDA